jgi:hypothetical protein
VPLETRTLPSTTFTEAPIIPIINYSDQAHLQAIYNRGQAQGNRSNVFAKLGDSITFANEFLKPIGNGKYSPAELEQAGQDDSLADTVAYFSTTVVDGTGANSFNRTSSAAISGGNEFTILGKQGGEIAATRPAFAVLMIGTNDVLPYDAETYRNTLRQIVTQLTNTGVIPILSTLPSLETFNGGLAREKFYQFQQVIVDVADEFQLPLINLYQALNPLPNDGLSADLVHPSVSPAGGGSFSAGSLLHGYNMRNLVTIQTLDKLREMVISNGPADGAPPEASSDGPLPRLTGLSAVGANINAGIQVRLVDANTGAVRYQFNPFPGFAGDVHTALGDVTGDGVADLLVAPGAGGGPVVKIYDGARGVELDPLLAFESAFRGGVQVATGDTDGDGTDEIIVGAGVGGGPRVRVLTRAGDVRADWFAYDAALRGGVRVAAGDTDGDGRAEIVTGAGSAAPHVRVFSSAGNQELANYFAYTPTLSGGVNVAAGDLDGDGRAEIVTGTGSAAPHVQVWDGQTFAARASFYAGDASTRTGVGVAVGRTGLVTTVGTLARRWHGIPPVEDSTFATAPTAYRDGVFVDVV